MNKRNFLFCLLIISYLSRAQTLNSWEKKADFAGIPRAFSIGFNIDSLGYLGCLGYIYQTDSLPYQQYPTDLWQYNPNQNLWVQKTGFPSTGRYGGICFVMGTKAYVGLGHYFSDIWEYDALSDTWSQKANFAGGTRDGAVAFSIGYHAYVGLGYSDTGSIKNDIWEYDQLNDSWIQKANFSGTPRQDAVGFNIAGKGYIGLGYSPNDGALSKNDFWEYDTLLDSWTQKADYPGNATGGTFCFSIGNKAYVGTGEDSSSLTSNHGFWEYNSSTNQWIQKDSFGGGLRSYGTGFSIGNKGYAGMGVNLNPNIYYRDFWMYTPDSIATGIQTLEASTITIYPDPATDKIYIRGLPTPATFTITDMTGRICATPLGSDIDVSALPSGVYCLHIQDSSGGVVRKFVKE